VWQELSLRVQTYPDLTTTSCTCVCVSVCVCVVQRVSSRMSPVAVMMSSAAAHDRISVGYEHTGTAALDRAASTDSVLVRPHATAHVRRLATAQTVNIISFCRRGMSDDRRSLACNCQCCADYTFGFGLHVSVGTISWAHLDFRWSVITWDLKQHNKQALCEQWRLHVQRMAGLTHMG